MRFFDRQCKEVLEKLLRNYTLCSRNTELQFLLFGFEAWIHAGVLVYRAKASLRSTNGSWKHRETALSMW